MYIRLDRILNERRKADKPNIHQGRLQIQNTSLTLSWLSLAVDVCELKAVCEPLAVRTVAHVHADTVFVKMESKKFAKYRKIRPS